MQPGKSEPESRDGDGAMTRDEFPDLAELWKEQADPAEQANLQALARQIKGQARGRRTFDFVAGAVAAGMILAALAWPASTVLRIALVLSILTVAVLVWRRQRIAAAALAMDVSEPRAFLAAAVKNAHAEVKFSTVRLFGTAPILGLWAFLIFTKAEPGFLVPAEWAGLVKLVLVIPGIAILYGVEILRIRRLRLRLRRLRAMARECDEEDSRDLTDKG